MRNTILAIVVVAVVLVIANTVYVVQQTERAIPCFERAIALAPREPQAHHNLAHVLQDQGRLEEALSHFRKATEDPQARALNCFAHALNRLGRREEAEEIWTTVREQQIEERRDAVRRDIAFTDPRSGKAYALKDEIATLATSFNRMRRSLEKAMQMLASARRQQRAG